MTVPAYLERLVDDAAIFPPAAVPLEQAVAGHRAHRVASYAALVGPFVVADTAITDLVGVLDAAQDADPLEVALVVTGGAGAIEPAVTWVSRSERLVLRAVEFSLRDEADLAHNARRLITVIHGLGDALDDVVVRAEPPMLTGADLGSGGPGHGWESALDELAAAEVPLKFRTGGATPDLFPSPEALATCIEAALDRELPFKCTAGLHRAVRHLDDDTGYTHHGFLNVLLATRVSLDGGGLDEVARTLADPDGPALAERLRADPDLAARTRRWFTAIGSCSVREAHDDLLSLGLIGAPA